MTNKRKMVWNREEISKLATNALVERASGFIEFDADVFAHLIAAAEREACAKQLDALGCDHCAAAIRARGKE
jgi:hypothetical protein